jgi:uncharacterized protein
MDATHYEVDIRTILEDLGATLEVSADVDLPLVVVGTEEFAPLEPAHLVCTLTNTGAGIVSQGTVHAVVNAECSRCLRTFPLDVVAEVEGFYIQHGTEDELPEEQDYEYITEGTVDVMASVLAALAVELPFAPVHSADCAGICPTCGADLNEGPCSCVPVQPASPFAVLKGLFEEGSGED